jgi:5-hydroxyisourate hydrolase-like protein (transthyretin family)
MDKELLKKSKIIAISILFIGASFLPQVGALDQTKTKIQENNNETTNQITADTEYWALLVAVAVYADDPQQNRPLMLEEVDDFYELLLESPWWSEDHIKVIKGEEATTTGIIQGLRWLDQMEDSDDISVVYITTHGFPLGVDIPPADEADGTDEALVSFWGFAYPNLYIWDDELNVLLNRLESQGVCLIVDSCYAGGFNDPPDWNLSIQSVNPFYQIQTDQAITKWIKGFGEEVRGQGRVVLMASCEDEVSYSGGFAPYLIDGFRGFGDTNMDGVVTAEEAFYYSEPRTYRQHPTMYDEYDGELPLIQLNEIPLEKNTDGYNNIKRKSDDRSLPIERADETSLVQGYVIDDGTSDPLENAYVSIRGRINGMESYENETITDSYGYYSMNIPAGERFRVSAYAGGYFSAESNRFNIDGNETRWVNLSLGLRPEETAMIYGYILDDKTSDSIEGATIDLLWYEGQNQYYQNETISDVTGYYDMHVASGYFELDFEAEGYFRVSMNNLYVENEEMMEINVVLYPRPEENAMVSGYITDEDTGGPIANARVELLWVDSELDHSDENETYTDSDGFYEINIAAGEVYHDIHKEGYDYYSPYRLDIVDFETLWMDVELQRDIFEVVIEKPLTAIYNNDARFMPFPKAWIFGSITISIGIDESYFSHGDADYVEIYIDDDLVVSLHEEPYTFLWDNFSIGKHTIKAVAYDDQGHSASAEREVLKLF